jgi:hypothetical protein
VLRKVGTIVGYEVVKRLLRDLLGYGRHSTAFVALSENEPLEVWTSYQGNEELKESLGQPSLAFGDAVRDAFLRVTKAERLDVIETGCLRTSKQHWTHAQRAKLPFDYLVEERPFITDLFSGQCFSGKQTLGELPVESGSPNSKRLNA